MTNPFPPQTEAERQAFDEELARLMDEDHADHEARAAAAKAPGA